MAKNCQMQTKIRLTKREPEKPCTVAIDTSLSVYLRQRENLESGKYGVMGEGGGKIM